jgi:hypothetical protein
MNKTLHPLRAVLHPLWCLALVGLLVNDHVLKGAGLLPSVVTGKLSDFAGYFLFPALLAVVGRVRTRRGFLWCHLATAALLLLTELSPAVCGLIQRVLGVRLWPDATDLVALFSVWASYVVLGKAAERTESSTLGAQRSRWAKPLSALGALASVATSPSQPPEQPVPMGPQDKIRLTNRSNETVQVRVLALRPEILWDCATATRPGEVLADSHFVLVRHVTMQPGSMLSLGGLTQRMDCDVLRVQAEGYSDRLVTWDVAAVSDPTTFVTMDLRDARAVSVANAVDHPIATLNTPPVPGCEPPSDETAVGYSSSLPAAGEWTLMQIARGLDGCDVLDLIKGGLAQSYTLCAEPLGVPFVAGDKLEFRVPANGATGVVVMGRDALGKTQTLALVAAEPSSMVRPVCGTAKRACVSGRPGQAVVQTAAGATDWLGAGQEQTQTVGGRTTRLVMKRVEQIEVLDSRCATDMALGGVVSYLSLSY